MPSRTRRRDLSANRYRRATVSSERCRYTVARETPNIFAMSVAAMPLSLSWRALAASADLYICRMGEPGHAVAGSRWYRTSQTGELIRWIRGEYANHSVDVPVRWLHGMDDPVITPTLLRGYADRFSDFRLETVDGVGHWIVEQRPELVLERLRAFLRET